MAPVVADNIIFLETGPLPEIADSKAGQIALVAAEEKMYFFSGTEWIAIGGSGSIAVVADAAAIPSVEDAEKGDVAIVEDKSILYFFDGSAWQSTQEIINIPEVYVAAGNIAVGTSLEGKTNQEMWEMLLTKEMNPTITQPSASISVYAGSTNLSGKLVEVGTSYDNLKITGSFNQGNVKKGWGDKATMSSTYAGLPTTYTYEGTTAALLSTPVSSTALSNAQTVSYVVPEGSITSKVTVAYSAGTYQPVTNYGKNYSSTCATGSKASGTVTFTGVYLIFASSSTITTATKQTLVAKGTYVSITFAAEGDGNKQFFDIPNTWGKITGVADSGGTWLNGNKANSLIQWTASSVTQTVQGNTINYTRYTHNAANSGIRTLRIYFN